MGQQKKPINNEDETSQINILIQNLINRLKDETKASEKDVKDILQQYAESV